MELKNNELSEARILSVFNGLEKERKEKVLRYSRKQLQEQNAISNYSKTNLYPVETIEKVSAGKGFSYSDNQISVYFTDRDNLKKYDVASVVKGDSMMPKYNDGDVVLIQNGYDNVNGGVYAIDYNGESFLKRVFIEGDRIRLVSYNKLYSDIIIDFPLENDVYLNIVGKVVDSFKPIVNK